MRFPRQRIRIFLFLAIALCAAIAPRALAHETRPAYLEIKETSPEHYDILWRTPVNAGMRLPIVLQLPKDAKNLSAPTLQELTDSLVERRVIEIEGGLAGKRIEFVGLQGTITDVLVRVEMLDGRKSTTIVHPSQSWFEMAASQSRWAVAGAFIVQGIRHISLGADHLLFLLGLLADRERPLDAVENRHRIYRGAQHHARNCDAWVCECAGDSVECRHRLEHSLSWTGNRARVARRNQFHHSPSRGSWRLCLVSLHGFGFAGALTSAGLPASGTPLSTSDFQSWRRNRPTRFYPVSAASRTFLPRAASALATLGSSSPGLYGRLARSVLDHSARGDSVGSC